MKQLNEFEKQMLIYRIDNLKNLSNKDFMVSFAGIVNDFDLLQKEDIENLQDHDWCRDNIKHEYTIIKSISKNVSNTLVEEKKDNTGRQRYYDNVFYIRGKNVLLSSEWYDGTGRKPDNKTIFINWLRSFVNSHYSNGNLQARNNGIKINNIHRPYITAIKSKPFLLLAGISGTGKSRIVRELARACWDDGSEEYEAQKPRNFEMVQVKPNWHDSSELIGYVSRVSGKPVFEAGDFLKFVAKAWENPEVPYFLCLDEMNLAPVEQYFAEYLSVVESRKADGNGVITTDPILKKCDEQWYFDLTAKLTNDDEIRARFNKDGICIPQNLIVVGTVNMDETTFSFSRKVLDRAMTIEMNEVDLYGGLTDRHEKIGKLEVGNLIGTAVEGVDVYKNNKDVCEKVINYLKVINANLEGTPFKVAYRTRNEFLLYVVNNLPYNKEEDGSEITQKEIIARALDEITSMKILSRIEGDETKIGNLLEQLREIISGQLKTISDIEYSATKNEEGKAYSISLAKLKEMEKRLKTSGYTSFWS
ncbi:MAG: AAA family ATPase [Prevotella sp.]|nr:AAA family ATPase [Prevotella sp.]